MPARALDVATYILQRLGPMSAMKLHKLLYYCQAWYLVWNVERLFKSKIEAWRDGPVVSDVYQHHRKAYVVDTQMIFGYSNNLTRKQKVSIDAVLKVYGKLSAWQLRERTHAEGPWKEARGNLAPDENSKAEITTFAMRDYYAARVNSH